MVEYKRGLSILCFTGLCLSAAPGGGEGQEGGFSARVCARAVPGELRSPVLGLVEETFLETYLLQVSCADSVPVYVRRKAFEIFCVLVTDGTERNCLWWFCPVFEEAAQRDGTWMTKPLILPRLLSSDLFRSNT